MVPENAAISIDALRASDEKNENNEIIPEKQTLNQSRVISFMAKNGIVYSNIDDLYNLDASLKLTNEGRTAMERKLAALFDNAKEILKKYESLDIMKEHDEHDVANQLEDLKTPPKSISRAQSDIVMQAWRQHNLIRDYAKRILGVEDGVKGTRKELMNPTPGIGDTIKDKLAGARENWDTMSGGQKLAFVAIAIFGGAMLMKSENEHVKAVRDSLFLGVKIAGAGWLLNKAWYIFTGESAFDAVTGATQPSQKSSKFMMETFKTTQQGAESLNKAVVMIGDCGFIDLLDRYEQAKEKGSTNLEGTKMPAGEAYKAMDVFTNKYKADLLRKEYAKYKPPIAFTQVMIAEMSKDPDVKLKDSLVGRVADYGEDKFKQAYNYLASTGPAVWIDKKYRSIFGKDGTKAEIEEFSKQFGYVIDTPADFRKIIQTKMAARDLNSGKKFVDCDISGKVNTKYGVKYLDGKDGYMYVIVEGNIGAKISDEKGLSQEVEKASDAAEAFLAEENKVNKSDVPRRLGVFGSVYIKSDSTMRYLVRYRK